MLFWLGMIGSIYDFTGPVRQSESEYLIKDLVSTIERIVTRPSEVRLDIMTREQMHCKDRFHFLQNAFSKGRLNQPNRQIASLVCHVENRV